MIVYHELNLIKRLFEEEEINVNTIGELSKEYLFDEEVAWEYRNHLQLLLEKASQRKQDKEEAVAARQSRVSVRSV